MPLEPRTRRQLRELVLTKSSSSRNRREVLPRLIDCRSVYSVGRASGSRLGEALRVARMSASPELTYTANLRKTGTIQGLSQRLTP